MKFIYLNGKKLFVVGDIAIDVAEVENNYLIAKNKITELDAEVDRTKSELDLATEQYEVAVANRDANAKELKELKATIEEMNSAEDGSLNESVEFVEKVTKDDEVEEVVVVEDAVEVVEEKEEIKAEEVPSPILNPLKRFSIKKVL